MFEHLETAQQVFHYRLGAALTMENTVLKMLGDLQEAARHDGLRELFARHAEETQEHIANLERCFDLMGAKVDDSPCPAIHGLQAEGKANIKMTDEKILDTAILASAAETEHHEIAVYDSLISMAEAQSQPQMAVLLRRNLEQEQRTLEEIRRASERVAREAVAVGAVAS